MIETRDLINAHEGGFRDFLFYDIEVFAHDALVVFKDIDGSDVAIFHNDFSGVKEVVENKVLVGYNNYHYDDYILTAMMSGKSLETLKDINDEIIEDEVHSTPIDDSLFTLDCFQQINVAKSSLKKIEANIGLSIDETAVPFDIDRELTESELESTIEYCKRDVEATVDVFKLRWFSYFVPKLTVLSMLEERFRKRALRWNTTTITASILAVEGQQMKWDMWRLGDSDEETDRLLAKLPHDVPDIWDFGYLEYSGQKSQKYTHHEYGCAFEFSQGGLHGVSENGRKKFDNVKLLDVTSLYPNILVKINALGKATERYKGIIEQRVKVKYTDQVLSNALKLVINSTYGLMKNEYSRLYNPMAALSVCIYGQIILYDLCGRLAEEGYTLVNVNTDGVAFCGSPLGGDFEKVWHEWEEEYGFSLELSEFATWIQKDVNNYVAVGYNGAIKVKGGEVNHYYDPTDYLTDPLHCKAGVTWTGTNTKSIIHHCVVNKLVNGTDFVDTVVNNLDNPILFQYVLSCGNTYMGTFDEDGRQYQKVNRVFAARDGVTLKKKKKMVNKDGETVESMQYFPNAPKKMFVYNGDLREFDNFKDIVDVDFYTSLAMDKYEKLWT